MDRTKLQHLYVSPLEACNLRCQMCYTTKTKNVLNPKEIDDFIKRVDSEVSLESITFCGGEVMILPWFPTLINQLVNDYYLQVITNGTIDRLEDLKRPDNINLIVSVDGLPDYHDRNRGSGNWQKSLNFLKKAKLLGFKFEIFSILTQENYASIDQFEAEINSQLGNKVPITYHPRKPLSYLRNHPWSNQTGQIEGFNIPNEQTVARVVKTKKIFPPPDLGCYQLALMSDKHVYGCCEGFRPLGTIDTSVKTLIQNLEKRIQHGCAEPDFRCGLGDLK